MRRDTMKQVTEFAGGRGSGKTHRLIEWANSQPAGTVGVLVLNKAESEYLRARLDPTVPIFTQEDVLYGSARIRAHHRHLPIAIDNVDRFDWKAIYKLGVDDIDIMFVTKTRGGDDPRTSRAIAQEAIERGNTP